MRNSYIEKIRKDRLERLERLGSAIRYNENQIARMGKELFWDISVESFHAINDRKVELFNETKLMKREHEILKEIIIDQALRY